MIAELFTHHPATVGESYTEHMGVAAGFGTRLFLASLACFVHSFSSGPEAAPCSFSTGG